MAKVKGATTGTTNGAASWSDDPGRADRNAAHLAGLEAAAAAVQETRGGRAGLQDPVRRPIVLPQLEIGIVNMRIVGDSELIVHRWSEKARKELLGKQMQQASAGKEAKNPDEDYRQSFYTLPDGGYGFPTIAFKCAAVDACTSLGKTVTKVQARQAFHVVGELVRIEGEPRMRDDMVRLNGQTADIRFRAGFPEWSCALTVRFNQRVLSSEQIINLLNTAGFAVGVGEWRPEKNGQFGLFHVE